jgi:DNA-binding CsgD family transcriptional regulator
VCLKNHDDVVVKNYITPSFSEKTCVGIVTLIESLENAQSVSEFRDIIGSQLRALLPHELSIFGIGDPRTMRVNALIEIDYPMDFLSSLIVQQPSGMVAICPVVQVAIATDRFLEINNTLTFETNNEIWSESVRQHGINNTFAKAQIHNGGKFFTYHGFTNGNTKERDGFRRISKIIFPHIDKALLRLLIPSDDHQPSPNLTGREQQVLNLLYLGYKDKEIASKLNISLFTVKSHLQNIYQKLESNNRTQAVKKALDSNLIQEEYNL